jgi:hypothetical protein
VIALESIMIPFEADLTLNLLSWGIRLSASTSSSVVVLAVGIALKFELELKNLGQRLRVVELSEVFPELR